MADQIEVSGLDEIRQSLLRDLPEALQGKASQIALSKAAKPIVDSAKAKTRSKRTRAAVTSSRNSASTKTYESRFIGVKRKAWWWIFEEFGRGIVETTKRTLGTPAKGFFGKKVRASPARPFLRPAFEENARLVPDIYAREIQPAIDKVAAKAQARSLRRIRKAITGF